MLQKWTKKYKVCARGLGRQENGVDSDSRWRFPFAYRWLPMSFIDSASSCITGCQTIHLLITIRKATQALLHLCLLPLASFGGVGELEQKNILDIRRVLCEVYMRASASVNTYVREW